MHTELEQHVSACICADLWADAALQHVLCSTQEVCFTLGRGGAVIVGGGGGDWAGGGGGGVMKEGKGESRKAMIATSFQHYERVQGAKAV